MKSVKVNSKICEIWESLSVTLQRLRFQSQTRVLWMDDNQNGVKERKYQVVQMGIIYSRAQTVMTWLGPPAPRLSSL
jgi:hypothetical protein